MLSALSQVPTAGHVLSPSLPPGRLPQDLGTADTPVLPTAAAQLSGTTRLICPLNIPSE